jgi:hypothetical protein
MTHLVNLGGVVFDCATNFKAIQLISEHVGDPIQMAQDEARRAEAFEQGKADPGGYRMSIKDMANIIFYGVMATGKTADKDEIGEAMMKIGPAVAMEPVGEYLARLVAGEENYKAMNSSSKKEGKPGKP